MNIKNAATDHPILKLLAERWSPHGFDDRPVADADHRRDNLYALLLKTTRSHPLN